MPTKSENSDNQNRSPNETKRDTFLRLAEKRLKAVQDKLRILSNLANVYAYDFEESDIDKLFDNIEQSVRDTRKDFDSALKKKRKMRSRQRRQ